MTTTISDPGVFSVVQLREFLRARGLSATGPKTELVARLMEADPSGGWMAGRSEDDVDDDAREDLIHQREIELYKREKEIAERELGLARQEIALLRERQNVDSGERRGEMAASDGGDVGGASPYTRLNLTMIADLLASFDGILGDFDTWER